MAKDRGGNGAPPETVISIIGPGMQVIGECSTDGTIRIEGTVQGTVRAGKAVVVGKDGAVDGDVFTQDAVISGRIKGMLIAESRLELQATCRIEGEVRARRMQLEEGAILNGTVQMGENFRDAPAVPASAAAQVAAPSADASESAPADQEAVAAREAQSQYTPF
jgi:cytoskeletal protein CcmA (bactofilin family)